MGGLAKRYSLALDASVGPGQSGQALAELETLAALVAENPAFKKFLESPGIGWSDKEAILDEIEKRAGALPTVVKFLKLVVKNRRLKELGAIVAAYREIRDTATGIRRAKLVSARPLAPATAERIRKRLGEILGTAVVLEHHVKPELVAGVQLRVGSTVYDGSVASAFKSLRSTLLKGSA